jgi:hypothetical protein
LWADPVVKPDAAQIDSMFNEVDDTLRSPAFWSRQQMRTASPRVERLAFMFRARADLLVVTERRAIWLELKVATSLKPRRGDGYSQSETQRDIADAAHLVVPELANRKAMNLVIQREVSTIAPHLTWQQLVGNYGGFDILRSRNRK